MVHPALKEVESVMLELQSSKPPGVSGSRINKLVRLALDNKEQNAGIVSLVYTQFKKTPQSHKLGMLYVVDAIARSYQDHARRAGESLDDPVDDSFSGGLFKFSELVESLMNNILNESQKDNFDRIKKVIEIWERAATFSPSVVARMKLKIDTLKNDTAAPADTSSNVQDSGVATATVTAVSNDSSAAKPDPAAVLAALASLAKAPGAQPMQLPAQPITQASTRPQQQLQQPQLQQSQQPHQSPLHQRPAMPMTTLPPSQQNVPAPVTMQSLATNGALGFSPEQVQLVQLLLAQGLSADKIQAVLSGISSAPQSSSTPLAVSQLSSAGTNSPPPQRQQYLEQQAERGRSVHDRQKNATSRRHNTSPPHPETNSRNFRGDSRSQYTEHGNIVNYDSTLPSKSIKVLSRTIFVGGVTNEVSEHKLKSQFSDFGPVQSVIIGHGSRHAFVKMYKRRDAEEAVRNLETFRLGSSNLRTKWGVGFGPRSCSDYITGVSVIPISSLTEADLRWIVSAEYGGTGGRPLEEKVVVEEPDIIIGAGISSKVMSKRNETKPDGISAHRRGGGSDKTNADEPHGSMLPHERSLSGQSSFPPSMPVPGLPNMPLLPKGMPDFMSIFGKMASMPGQVPSPIPDVGVSGSNDPVPSSIGAPLGPIPNFPPGSRSSAEIPGQVPAPGTEYKSLPQPPLPPWQTGQQ